MKVRIVQIAATVALLVAGIVLSGFARANSDIPRGHGAVMVAQGQQAGDAGRVAAGRAVQDADYGRWVWLVVLSAILLVWLPTIVRGVARLIPVATVLLAVPLLTACFPQGTQTQTRIVNVGASETAFVINATLPPDQVQLDSAPFLEKNKIPSGQVPVKYSQVRTKTDNRRGHNDEWTAWKADNYIFLIDRAPVTRQWTDESTADNNPDNDSIHLQSEGIQYHLGFTCTGQVDERDAAIFIATYAGTGRQEVKDEKYKDLPAAVWMVGAIAIVMDHNVRGEFQTQLTAEFNRLTLDQANKQMGDIVLRVTDRVAKDFKARGLTLLNCGMRGGFLYQDQRVQDSFNSRQVAEQQALAQQITNQKNIDQAKADAAAAKAKQDQEVAYVQSLTAALRDNPEAAQYIAANKWNGVAPTTVVGGSSAPPFINVGGQK